MPIDTFAIRFYKNNVRIAPGLFNRADVRLFYKQLKLLISSYEKKYGEKLNNESILVVSDDKNIYRKRSRLETAGIETVEDMMEYLDIEPKYIIADNIIITDTSIKLSEIYVLQLYSSWLYLTDGQLQKIEGE
jgi:hypothetical protein